MTQVKEDKKDRLTQTLQAVEREVTRSNRAYLGRSLFGGVAVVLFGVSVYKAVSFVNTPTLGVGLELMTVAVLCLASDMGAHIAHDSLKSAKRSIQSKIKKIDKLTP